MGQLRASGKDVTHEAKAEDEGNIVVINTCGFIDNAKAESVNMILEYADKKEKGLVDKVFVTGCLSQRYKGIGSASQSNDAQPKAALPKCGTVNQQNRAACER